MIIYSSTKANFKKDVMTNDIGNIIYDAFRSATGRKTSESEISSWMNSLEYMDRVLNHEEIPDDTGVAIEYHLPQTSKRIDFILTGKDYRLRETAILIELKQWKQAQRTEQDAIVVTQFKHGSRETLHPSYQAWSYKRLLEDFNETVQEEKIQLYPCAYLHNYEEDGVISHDFYYEHIRNAPLFLKRDALKLQEFIKKNVKYGDKNQLMYRIDHGKIKPSKNLADQLLSMLKGNQEFILIDAQKVIFENAIRMARICSEKKKKVLIVEGGPGTGKSVVAINILVALTGHEFVAKYVTRNSAPRLVYEAILTGSFTRNHISNLFSGSGSFHSIPPNSFDCLIVDEAHRLNEKSGMFQHLGENQAKEIISSSKLSIFFIDEDQKVTLKDIGSKDEIRRWAKKLRADVTETSLESQFRCNGSDGYLAWLANTLQIRETANEKLDTKEYDFRIIRSPAELHALIREKNRAKDKARLVAGYCWDWISKKDPLLKDIVIGDYQATWNLESHGQAWIIKPGSVNEVGCIHTCQGLELDYVGVIAGPDLIVRNGIVKTLPEKRASTDHSIRGWKKLTKEDPELAKTRLDAIIKNTYRTLMTRGQKGCYVYFVDDETRDFFTNQVITTPASKQIYQEPPPPEPNIEEATLPFRHLSQDEAKPFENCVPLYDLQAAAGPFGEEQIPSDLKWVQISDAFRPRPDLFVIQVNGKSMNRRIPDGSWCLFKKSPGGTRQGTVVLAQHREISDNDNGGHYTIKVYDSKKRYHDNGTWRHESITLHPDTTEEGYQPILIEESQAEELDIIGEFVAVLGSQFAN